MRRPQPTESTRIFVPLESRFTVCPFFALTVTKWELRWTLGIKVKGDLGRKMAPDSKQTYIKDLVERFGLQDAQDFTTYPKIGAILAKDQCPKYRNLTGKRYRNSVRKQGN